MLAIGEDLILPRQERAAGVDEVEAGEPVFERDLLRAQVLLHGERVVGAALDRRVVRDDDAHVPADTADSSDHAGGRCFIVVHAERRQRRELQERSARIEEALHPLAWQELPGFGVTLARALGAAQTRLGQALTKLRDELLHRLAVVSRRLVARVGLAPWPAPQPSIRRGPYRRT